jgi:Zn-finger protein
MGTRSTIALEFADGTVEQVYCHWDGYLEHNGKILFEHYSDPFKLRDLIDMGDMSSLGGVIGEAHPFSPHASKEDEALYEAAKSAGYCTFYARDRGETGVSSKKFKDFEDYKANHQYEEYEYILRNVNGVATWFVADHSEVYMSLEEVLTQALEVEVE